MSNDNQNIICPNCEKNSGTGKFCQECGQKNKELNLNLFTIFGNFFSIIFNIDNQFIRTIKAVVIPSELANNFILGKRKYFLGPFRFFLYSWTILALVISTNSDKGFINDIEEGYDTVSSYDTLANNTIVKKDFIITLNKRDFRFTDDVNKYQEATNKDEEVILNKDIDSLDLDQLYQKYNIKKWYEKLLIKRAKKFDDRSLKTILQFAVDNLIWLFFFVIPFSALFLLLYFYRSKRYYSEHILYLMYLFSVLFLFLSLSLIFEILIPTGGFMEKVGDYLSMILLILFPFYSYFSMKRFYKKSWRKTLMIWILYLFTNSLLFLIGGVFYFILSIILF